VAKPVDFEWGFVKPEGLKFEAEAGAGFLGRG